CRTKACSRSTVATWRSCSRRFWMNSPTTSCATDPAPASAGQGAQAPPASAPRCPPLPLDARQGAAHAGAARCNRRRETRRAPAFAHACGPRGPARARPGPAFPRGGSAPGNQEVGGMETGRRIDIALNPEVEIDAALVAEGLGLAVGEFRRLMEQRRITVLCERGTDEDAGLYRATFYHGQRRVRLGGDGRGRAGRGAARPGPHCALPGRAVAAEAAPAGITVQGPSFPAVRHGEPTTDIRSQAAGRAQDAGAGGCRQGREQRGAGDQGPRTRVTGIAAPGRSLTCVNVPGSRLR